MISLFEILICINKTRNRHYWVHFANNYLNKTKYLVSVDLCCISANENYKNQKFFTNNTLMKHATFWYPYSFHFICKDLSNSTDFRIVGKGKLWVQVPPFNRFFSHWPDIFSSFAIKKREMWHILPHALF